MTLSQSPRGPAPSSGRAVLSITRFHDAKGTVVVGLFGELDLSSVRLFRVELAAAEAEDGPLAIDLSGVNFIDSSGLAELLYASQRADAAGREIVFRGAAGRVERALELSGLDRVLPLAA